MSTTRICSRCNQTKPLDEFPKNKALALGRQYYCRKCKYAYQKNKKLTDPAWAERLRARNARNSLLSKFGQIGISREEIDIAFTRSNGKCDICGRTAKLCVDHCHETNRIRGILCSSCNVALGHFRDNISYLENAIDYLHKQQNPVI